MDRPQTTTQSAAVLAEASKWLIEFRSGDVDSKARKTFSQWLQTSPEHMRAYLELSAIWNETPSLGRSAEFSDEALTEAIRAEAEQNVVSLGSHRERSSAANPPRLKRLVGWGMAAALLLVLGVCTWALQYRSVFSTGIGEQRAFTLSDGSRIEMNSDSKVKVEFTQSERRVKLIRGQALFRVAKDASHPFVVISDSAMVRAVGTEFDVNQRPSGITVTVVEGRVVVVPLAPGENVPSSSLPSEIVAPSSHDMSTFSHAFYLAMGEQAVVNHHGATKASESDTQAAIAWTHGELVFKGAALQDVAAEFNRYNEKRFVIQDQTLAAMKVTGIFSSTDRSGFLRFLEARPDIAVTEHADEVWVARKQP